MDEVVQRGCELRMLRGGAGGGSPGSSESCRRSSMPQTENFTHTGEGRGGRRGCEQIYPVSQLHGCN